MRHGLPVLFAAVLTAVVSAQSAAPFNDSIRLAELKADLYFLAGDGFKGRLVGTPENALAAEFVRSRFERAGLKPARRTARSCKPRSSWSPASAPPTHSAWHCPAGRHSP